MVGFSRDNFIAHAFEQAAHQNFFVLPAFGCEVREGKTNFDFFGRGSSSFTGLGRALIFGDVAIDIIVGLEFACYNEVINVVFVDLLYFKEYAGNFTFLGVVNGQFCQAEILHA